MPKWLIGLSILLVAAYFMVLAFGKNIDVAPISCPIYQYSGLLCGGCGTQSAVLHLIQFEFREAFFQNPLLFFILPYLLLGFFTHYFKSSIRCLSADFNQKYYGSKAAAIVLSVIILWTLVRNL